MLDTVTVTGRHLLRVSHHHHHHHSSTNSTGHASSLNTAGKVSLGVILGVFGLGLLAVKVILVYIYIYRKRHRGSVAHSVSCH